MPNQAPSDLFYVCKIVNRPAGEQLRERDDAEVGMDALTIEIGIGDFQVVESRKIVGPQALEFVEQRHRSPSVVAPESTLAIERRESLVVSRSKDQLDSRLPVGDLGVRDMNGSTRFYGVSCVRLSRECSVTGNVATIV